MKQMVIKPAISFMTYREYYIVIKTYTYMYSFIVLKIYKVQFTPRTKFM